VGQAALRGRILVDQMEFATYPDLDAGNTFTVRSVPLDPDLLTDLHPLAINGHVDPDEGSAGRGRAVARGQKASQHDDKNNQGCSTTVHLATSLGIRRCQAY
jgi:hypothetical protein